MGWLGFGGARAGLLGRIGWDETRKNSYWPPWSSKAVSTLTFLSNVLRTIAINWPRFLLGGMQGGRYLSTALPHTGEEISVAPEDFVPLVDILWRAIHPLPGKAGRVLYCLVQS